MVTSALEPDRETDPRRRHYLIGIAMILAGGVCLSFGGLILRQVQDAGIWQVIFYRFLFMTLMLLAFLALRYGRHLPAAFAATGRGGLLIAAAFGGGSVFYVLALDLTTVANAMFVLSAAPIVTAVLGWAVLGERVPPITWIAISGAAAGILVMVIESLGAGRLAGNLAALGTVLSFATMLMVIRRAKSVDMVPATCGGGILGGAVAAIWVGGDLAIGADDLLLCLLMGTGQVGAGFLLITTGARFVPAAEVALLALIEVGLAPLWVWLWIDETPSGATLAGGAIVLAAVLLLLLYRLRRERAAPL